MIVPGGFSYGDYLRAGAIARFAPVMEEVAEFARAGGLVLGICNGFQVLCEARLLPGALLPNVSLRFICRQVELEVVDADTPFTRACEPGDRLSIPVKHTTGRYYAPERRARPARGGRAGAAALRARPQPQRLRARHRRRAATRRGNVFGLMPHPEHAVDPLTGSTDGLKIFESMRAHVGDRSPRPERQAPPRARAHRRRVRADRRAARPRAERRRAGDALADVVRALRLQALEASCCGGCRPRARTCSWDPARTPARSTSATGSRSRSRSSRTTTRARSSRSRARPPASAASCATCSRSARGRSRCSTRCASASRRDSERSRYLLAQAVAGIGHYGNSIGVPTVGGEIYFESSYEQNCLVNAMCLGLAPRERLIRSAAAGPGNVARAARCADRPRRDRRRVGAGQRRARRGRRGQAPVGPDRRSVRREEAARVLPGAAGPRAARLAAGPRRRRPHLVGVGDGEQGRGRARHRRRAGPAARARDGAVRDHGLRVPGADAVRRRARARRSACSTCASTGRCWPRRSARSPPATACACSARRASWPTCRCRSWSTTARCTTSSRRRPQQPLYRPRRRRS